MSQPLKASGHQDAQCRLTTRLNKYSCQTIAYYHNDHKYISLDQDSNWQLMNFEAPQEFCSSRPVDAINWTMIGSHNGLPSARRQDFMWTNVGLLLIWALGTFQWTLNYNNFLSRKYISNCHPHSCGYLSLPQYFSAIRIALWWPKIYYNHETSSLGMFMDIDRHKNVQIYKEAASHRCLHWHYQNMGKWF